ncbi:MAG: excinuclease ABC subunit UvrC [Chitinophagales bacterium]
MHNELATIVKNLPELPGVYRYFDKNNKILYVGKAKNLKKRVSSYFFKKQESTKTKLLVKKIYNIEYSIVNSEKDALLLENELIKTLQPKYNINLKDDKSYPFIKIYNEHFPRIEYTRQLIKDGSQYFGPYTSLYQVKNLVNLIKKLYPIRNCTLNLSPKNIQQKKYKVCLEYHIGNCLAPCVGYQSEIDYNNNINNIKAILNGKLSEIKSIIKNQMHEAANELNFETAEALKKRLQFLDEYSHQSIIVNPKLNSMHVFGYYEKEQKACVNYLFIKEGYITKTKQLYFNNRQIESKEDIITMAFIEIFGTDEIADEIVIPFEVNTTFDKNLKATIPKIGDKKKLLDLANKNAKYSLLKGKNIQQEKSNRLLATVQKDLKLNALPTHIECFDNSNFQGKFPVAACVVFKNGKPSKKDYRHFNIKTVIGANDFDSMKEIVYRRYSRMIEEQQALPQLIVIDGGKGQLNAAIESLKQLDIYNKVQVISIAKRLEELYYPNDPIPLHLSKQSETLKLIQHLRNEAHRFGITFHRQKRDKSTLKTALTNIDSIGDNTAKKLLQHFGSIKNIQQANFEEW